MTQKKLSKALPLLQVCITHLNHHLQHTLYSSFVCSSRILGELRTGKDEGNRHIVLLRLCLYYYSVCNDELAYFVSSGVVFRGQFVNLRSANRYMRSKQSVDFKKSKHTLMGIRELAALLLGGMLSYVVLLSNCCSFWFLT